MYKDIQKLIEAKNCQPQYGRAMFDVLNVFTGKWKVVILCILLQENLRFNQIHKLIPTITPRMLSKELKELELNGLVIRRVYDYTPTLIEYGLTDSAKELKIVLINLLEWGIEHRKKNIGKH